MYSVEKQRQLYNNSKSLISQTSPLESNQIDELREILHFHEWKYSVMNDPVISDFEYDTLFKKLQKLETTHPSLKTQDSPTQRVSSDLITEFKTVPHVIPMLSLENSYNAEDLNDFDEQVKKYGSLPSEKEVEYVVEPKFDGGTIVLLYENDILVRAATRGNGSLGEEMTLNAKQMRSIPLKAAFSTYGIYKAELRGEALIRKDVFDSVNRKREEEGQTLFANPRNAATGGLRTKDPKETAARGLEAFIYQMGYAIDSDGNDKIKSLASHHDTINLLKSIGFKVPDTETKLCKNIAEVVDYCNHWQEKRDTYEYEIDGMVAKVNDLEVQARCGSTSHHPRWAIAFKFKAKQATTKLLNVEFQVGKIGSITPVAKLQPVQLAGVMVSSVSLHNEDFITGKDIRIGDTVLVERAGDVIPYIVKPMEELRDGTEEIIAFPKYCPMNLNDKVELIKTGEEAAWRCPNCTCGQQDYQRIVFHTSKDAMDIEGFSKATIERFMQLGWVKNMADLYRLDYEAVAKLEGFGQRSAQNMEKSITKAKNNPIQRVLYSLSIHQLGKKASKLIAAEIDNIFQLCDWTLERYQEIKDIGPIVAENASKYFSNEKNIAILKEMESCGVNMTQTQEDKKPELNTEGILYGKTILFTGSLSTMTRENAEKAAAAAGATVASAVSSKLNILVVGEKAGSKLKKAQALGTVQILSETEFGELMSM
jgi:DNA ligase (NAD+)